MGQRLGAGMPAWPRSYSRSPRMHAVCLPRVWRRVVLEPLVGGHLGGGPSGSGEFAEVVAGEVEGPLDLGFDLAAQP